MSQPYTTFRFLDSSSLLDSSAASTSIYTTTSSSIEPGIGALGGKFIYGFGKAILTGVENVVVRRRLSYIQSLCPLLDDRPPRNIEQIYDDLLKFAQCVIDQNTTDSAG
jgi:hypothetical protein